MPAPIAGRTTATPPAPRIDPAAEALRCLKSAFPLSQISLVGGNIMDGQTTLVTASEIASQSLQSIVVAAGARIRAAAAKKPGS